MRKSRRIDVVGARRLFTGEKLKHPSKSFARRVLLALRRRVIVRDVVLVFEAPPTSLHLAREGQDRDLRVVRATTENLDDLAWFQRETQLKTFRQMLESGQVGYLVYLDGHCVHRSWVALGPCVVNEHWSQSVRINAGETFLHYAETVSSARGLGIFPYLLRYVADDHPGVKVRMAIDSNNISSQRSALKAGWTLISRVRYTVVLHAFRWRHEVKHHPNGNRAGHVVNRSHAD